MSATTLTPVYDDFGRTVLIPAADVTPDMDRPYRLSPAPDLADRFSHGTGPAPKSWERPSRHPGGPVMRTISPAEYQRSREEREEAFWAAHAAFTDAGTVIAEVGGALSLYHFDANRPVTDARPEFRGFNGARWQVRFLDGREVITNDLYGNGAIPERFRHLFTVNAELELLERRPSS